jgi:hypothetical protein
MTSPPVTSAVPNPFCHEAQGYDFLITTQKTNLWIASATLSVAVIALLGILIYLGVAGQLKITEAGIASGLPILTGFISKLGIDGINLHIGGLKTAQFLATQPCLTPEEIDHYKVLWAKYGVEK